MVFGVRFDLSRPMTVDAIRVRRGLNRVRDGFGAAGRFLLFNRHLRFRQRQRFMTNPARFDGTPFMIRRHRLHACLAVTRIAFFVSRDRLGNARAARSARLEDSGAGGITGL